MIRLDNPDEVYSMNTSELWNIIGSMEIEEKIDYKTEIELIKNGINIKIPIIYIIKGWTEEHPETKRISIKAHGKYDITEYYDEVQERNNMMRQIILENIEEDEPNKPRT